MKRLNINDTFYTLTKDDPSLREVFINMGFAPMKDNATYNTVGRVVTLKKALNHVNKSLEEANAFLKEHGIEVELYEQD